MQMLGLDLDDLASKFVEIEGQLYTLVKVDAEDSSAWADRLGVPFRRCYITDRQLREATSRTSLAGADVVRSKIPDPGSVMSGDFGEILASFYFASRARSAEVLDPIKWRFKDDRTKAAPKSDVVQLFVPSWPNPSADDSVLCAEVKAKATKANFGPIKRSIEGSRQDREGRLAKTLVWLREIAITHGLEGVDISHLNRFIDAIYHPAYSREFKAVSVISAELVSGEVEKVQDEPDGCDLVVISVPSLKELYTAVFDEVVASSSADIENVSESTTK